MSPSSSYWSLPLGGSQDLHHDDGSPLLYLPELHIFNSSRTNVTLYSRQNMPSRHASHSGSWYTDNGRALARQLDGWLGLVPDTMDNVGSLPTAGARVIIAPYETLII